ncbi:MULTISPECIES: hypothetical protein [Methylomonas]|uniref:hypothetical protein n=1 Tax=Methylomonas TaxID=416 RepID=UPI001232D06F|nr:hypothetical protein [Methylomonas rhizoryzae]
MVKVKMFNIVITLAAFAALVFLLPADKDLPQATKSKQQTYSSKENISTKSNEKQSTTTDSGYLRAV